MMLRFVRNSDGSAALEFAIVAPMWIAFVVGIVQTASLLWVDNMMHNVTDITARCMAINVNNPSATKCTDLASMRTFAVSASTGAVALWGSTEFALNDSAAGACVGGSQVSIVHSDSFMFAVPVTLSAKACYPNWN